MIGSGPYRTPPALAHVPLMALFWTLLAPFIFQTVTLLLASIFISGDLAALFRSEDKASLQTIWLIFVISHMFLFIALTLWTEAIGTGPFAGSLHADRYWLLLALGLGPVILIGAGALAGMLFSNGDPEWLYRGEKPPAYMSAAAFGPMMIMSVVVLAPLVEEVAFRGVALGCLLARGWPPLHAALLTSTLFTVLHFQYVPLALIPVFLIGMFLAWLRIRSGSMAAPVLAHMAANGITLLMFSLSA